MSHDSGAASQTQPAARFSVDPPVAPMLAKPISGLPETADGVVFEPKWDGFRAVVYRRGDDVAIQGRMRAPDAAATGSWDLTYAFPEMVQAVRTLPADDVVLDGELVVIRDGRLSFDALQGRLRPRKEEGGWKITQLAADFPTSFVAFDVLGAFGRDLRRAPFRERREVLAAALADVGSPIHLTPQTRDLAVAERWVRRLPGAGLDGLIVRPLAGPYTPGQRTLFKVKPMHTVDVVCAAWRPYARPGPDGQEVVGSILIGLYDHGGGLRMIGAVSAFPMAVRVELADRFAAFAAGSEHPWFDAGGTMMDTASRWSAGRSTRTRALRPELVAEVRYNQADSGRLRHLASLVRWRPDKAAGECTLDGLVTPEPLDIDEVLSATV